MKISFLIVTKNRRDELIFTLNKLKAIIDLEVHEVLVFIDGCSDTEIIINDYNWVKWTTSKDSISASPARQILYKKAKGDIFIGLDDDAHPISENFIETVEQTFIKDNSIGIIAFQEVRGVFNTDSNAINSAIKANSHFTNDFIGCGFAITKNVYDKTRGFPVWIDIYGEEPALALEVLDLDYNILYQPDIVVNHRINTKKRQQQRKNYFRFERLLKNNIRFYLVYYPQPFKKVLKIVMHNFIKYAIKDWSYFRSYFKVMFSTLYNLPLIYKYRKPVKKETIERRLSLKRLNYSAASK